MKPFSFTENKTQRTNSRCLSRSVSSPNLTTPNDKSEKPKSKPFKAKPCPKNLFSNYFYHKSYEDEYFRDLNRKLRSEELLKTSRLPPSMAKREKNPKKQCYHIKSTNHTSSGAKKGKKRRKNNKKRNSISDFVSGSEKFRHRPFITTTTEPFDFETEKRSQSRLAKV